MRKAVYFELCAISESEKAAKNRMRIGLQTWGSEGDVRPMAALAAGLAGAGHDVTLAITEVAVRDYSALAARHGFRLIDVGSPVLKSEQEMDALGRDMLLARHPAVQGRLLLQRAFAPALPAMTAAAKALCTECDVLIGHFFLYPLQTEAERAGKPWLAFHPGHCYMESRYARPPGVPDLGEWFHPIAWSLARWGANRLMLADVNTSRKEAGLAAFRDVLREAWISPHLNFVGVSREIFGRPADLPPHTEVTGFLGFPAEDSVDVVSPEVEDFLKAGEPPVYFGFGSLMPGNPESIRELARLWRGAARIAGCRAIIQVPSGESDAGLSDRSVMVVRRGAHAAVFPRCAAIVHHGGAGTTHAALLAGRPSIVVPHVADQFFWAAELRRLGVSGKSLYRVGLSEKSLGRAVRQVLDDPRMSQRARTFAEKVPGASGVSRAVEAFQRWSLEARVGRCS
jgi:sterol 3beta-glucosyltransferase/vancomycin aglycone glucosyltransferase